MPEEEFIESKHLSRLEWKIYEVDKSLRGSSSSFRTLAMMIVLQMYQINFDSSCLA